MATKTKKIITPYDAALANAKASLFSPAQLRNIAGQQASAQIGSSLGGVNAASAIEQRQYTDLAERAAGIAKSLGSFGPGYGERAFDAFNEAGKTIGSLGTGLVGSVAQDWQGEQAANQATVEHALGPGQGRVESYDPAAMRSALQYTGVTMPGSGLANQALTAKSMAEYGAQADQAQVARVSQDAIAEARKALDARAAERAAIVAKRPELYQAALTAQREDNARTQAHVDNLVNASQTWLQNQAKLKQDKVSTAHDWWLKQVAATHVDPRTGEPVGGWTWKDKAHTIVWPVTSAVAARQAGLKIGQADRSLDITEQHYKDWKSNADKVANLRTTASKQTGKFDKNMSAATHVISDSYGRPILINGKVQPYKTPGKPPKPMDVTTRLKIQASMTNYADALKNGAKDPKTGAEIQKAVDVKTAIEQFQIRGYLQGQLYPWGVATLSQAYGLTPQQLDSASRGFDPYTGGAYGSQPGDYDVHPPETAVVAHEAEVRAAAGQGRIGAKWNPKTDPKERSTYEGKGRIITVSGHIVGPDGRYES